MPDPTELSKDTAAITKMLDRTRRALLDCEAERIALADALRDEGVSALTVQAIIDNARERRSTAFEGTETS